MTISRKILIVDDDAGLLAGLNRVLGDRFEIVAAQSGKEALTKVLSDGPFAVIVSDMRMPGMDGLEVLQRMQDLAPSTVRMMLTGNVDQSTAVKAINAGNVFRFFNKPMPIKDLADGIEAGLKQYELNVAAIAHLKGRGADDLDRGARLRSRLEEFKKASPSEVDGMPVQHYVVNLAAIRNAVPQQWPNVRDKAVAIADGIISAGMGRGDSYRDIGDDVFIIMLPSLNPVDGAVRARTICEKICSRLLGSEFNPSGSGNKIIQDMQDIKDDSDSQSSDVSSSFKKIVARSKQDIVDSVNINYRPIWHPETLRIDGYRASFQRNFLSGHLHDQKVLQGGSADPLWADLYRKMIDDISANLGSINGSTPYVVISVNILSMELPEVASTLSAIPDLLSKKVKIIIELTGLDDDFPLQNMCRLIAVTKSITRNVVVRISPDSPIVHELKISGVDTIGLNFADIHSSGLGRRGSYVIASHFAKKAKVLGFNTYAFDVDTIPDFQIMMATSFRSVSGLAIGKPLPKLGQIRPLSRSLILDPPTQQSSA